jgi:hypothetical protein
VLTVRPLRRTVALCLGLFALCCSSHLRAENGRNFAGSYQLQNVHSDGSTVSFELSLKLFNYAGFDLVEGRVTLAGHFLPPDSPTIDFRGEFNPVSVKYRKFVSLKGAFAVPVTEFEQWQKGATPNLVVTYVNDAGESMQNSVELTKIR